MIILDFYLNVCHCKQNIIVVAAARGGYAELSYRFSAPLLAHRSLRFTTIDTARNQCLAC